MFFKDFLFWLYEGWKISDSDWTRLALKIDLERVNVMTRESYFLLKIIIFNILKIE